MVLERLSALDAGFLALETEDSPLHLGCVLLLEGPAPEPDAFLAEIRRRVAAVPECRRRVRRVAAGLARPVWEIDTGFDAARHVVSVAIPAPGDDRALRSWVATDMESRLDIGRPPWAVHQVTGLENGRWALVIKAHHSLVDGSAGTGLLGALLASGRPDRAMPAVPLPLRSGDVVLAAMTWTLTLTYRAGYALARAVTDRRQVAQHLLALRAGVRTVAVADLPPSPLSGRLGRRRTWGWTAYDLADAIRSADARRCTVNDLFLAALAGGYRRHLLDTGAMRAETRVRVIVPVSMRRPGEPARTGNIDAAFFVELPVHAATWEERVAAVAAQTRDAKARGVARSTHALVRAADHVPCPVLTRVARAYVRRGQRRVNLAASDVRGPAVELDLCGCRVLELVPVTPVALDVRTSWSMLSYAGRLTIAVTADADGVPEFERLLSAVDASMKESMAARVT